MSRRNDERSDRERDRGSRSALAPSSLRTNEYFVPKDGIDREVITADICRYLGNDALVRPGVHEDPRTRDARAGYFITAYRNLTSAMIEDLKADSQRWAAEREATSSRSTPNAQEYRASMVHQSRQYYGPTESMTGAAAAYATPAPTSSPGLGSNYESRTSPYGQHGQSYANSSAAAAYPSPVSTAYQSPAPGVGAFQDKHYYMSGVDYSTDRVASSGRGIAQPNAGLARSSAMAPGYSQSAPGYQTSPDERYYTSPTMQVPGAGYGKNIDPSYGRGAPVDYPRDVYTTSAYPDGVTSYRGGSMAPPSGREPRDMRDTRDLRDLRDIRESRESRDSRDARDVRHSREDEIPTRSNKHSRHYR